MYGSGEAPSQVEITNVSKPADGGVSVAWKAPNIPNGVIQSYEVHIQLLNENGQIVFMKMDSVMVSI